MSESDLSAMDRQARRFLAMVSLGATDAAQISPDRRRRSFEQLMRFAKRPATEVGRRDTTMTSCGHDVALRVYTPVPAHPTMPGLIYFHGGGLVAGSLDTHEPMCLTLAQESGCRIVAVGYRLAPEHPFPAAILDALGAARWITRHAADFGLARDAIGVGGDSGGATLAAIVCQKQPRRFKAQVLLCPVLDAAGCFASRRAFADGFLLDAATMAQDLAHYAPQRPLADPWVSPLQAASLDGLPPTVIHTAGFDPLCDEGAAYATRLEAAGVAVDHTCHATLIHHFYGLAGMIPAAVPAISAIAADIRRALA